MTSPALWLRQHDSPCQTVTNAFRQWLLALMSFSAQSKRERLCCISGRTVCQMFGHYLMPQEMLGQPGGFLSMTARRRRDRRVSWMVIAKHVILSEVEESPVCSIVLNAKHAVNTFARRRRRPFGFVSTTVREQAGRAFFPSPFPCQELRRADRNVRPTFTNASSQCGRPQGTPLHWQRDVMRMGCLTGGVGVS